MAEAEPAETNAGSDWQSAQWAGTSGRSLSLIGSQRDILFFYWLLLRAFLIGLQRQGPPLPESYWVTAAISDWRMTTERTSFEASDWLMT